MGVLNKTMLGTDEIYDSVILDKDNPSVAKEGGVAYSNGGEGGTRKEVQASRFSNGWFKGWKVPNILYCPENIFSNKIPALDVNFIHPNSYTNVYGEGTESYASRLAPTIASWYKAFRNISVVGLLCVLVYLGIRILIETSAQGKAKYKEALLNWFVALCLVFAIHFIMAGTLMLIDKVTELLNNSLGDSTIYVDVIDGSSQTSFKTNLTGYVRFMAESEELGDTAAYTIIYLVLVIYTIMFTFTYLKRFLWMAFLTMIAPLVSLTYPIDKAGDGKAQAFNMWFKEYIMNAILQPVHLLLYSVMVSSAMDLASNNPIYALVAIGFLIPAEKFIKKMFGLDKGQTAGGLGSFAGGAMTMKALESLGKKAPPPLKGADRKGNNRSEESDSGKIYQNKRGTLESFKDNENIDINSQDFEENEALDAGRSESGSDNINGIEENNDFGSVNYSEGHNQNGLENGNENNFDYDENDQLDYGNGSNNGNNAMNTPSRAQRVSSQQNRSMSLGSNTYKGKPIPKNSVGKALGRTLIRGAKTIPNNGRFIARKALRGSVKGAGALMGATIGLAAGIASGDPSKAFQYGVAGLAAGNKIGDGAFNLGDKAVNTVGNIVADTRNAYREERYSLNDAKQIQRQKENEKAKKTFMKNDEEKKKYREIVAKIQEDGGNCTLEQAMNAAFDYKVAGLSDDQISTGLQLEAKHGGVGANNHEQMMDIMNLTNKYSQDHILDEKKRNAMEGSVESIVGKENKEKVMQLFAEAQGQGAYYKNLNKKQKTTKK